MVGTPGTKVQDCQLFSTPQRVPGNLRDSLISVDDLPTDVWMGIDNTRTKFGSQEWDGSNPHQVGTWENLRKGYGSKLSKGEKVGIVTHVKVGSPNLVSITRID